MKRNQLEEIAALVAATATAYVALHKLYGEVKSKRPVAVVKGPEGDLPERTTRRLRPTPRPKPRRRGWPCYIQMLLLELVGVATIVLVVLLTRGI